MNALTVDPARVVQQLVTSGTVSRRDVELAMHAVALEDAHARIAELTADKAAD